MGGATNRRELSRLARREAIIDTARTAFLEKGFAATSMSEIALSLGGSKGTLWGYFPSKEVQFGAVVHAASDELPGALEDCFHARNDVYQTLSAFAARHAYKLRSPTAIHLLRFVAAEFERFPELGVILYNYGLRSVVQRLSRYLLDAMAEGRLLKGDAEEPAYQFCVMLKQPTHGRLWYRSIRPGEAPEFNIQSSVDMLRRAYAPATSRSVKSNPELSPRGRVWRKLDRAQEIAALSMS